MAIKVKKIRTMIAEEKNERKITMAVMPMLVPKTQKLEKSPQEKVSGGGPDLKVIIPVVVVSVIIITIVSVIILRKVKNNNEFSLFNR